MKLFKKENDELRIEDEIYLLLPFRKLIDRDKSDGKYISQLELGYIYFMEDPRSDYKMFLNEEERAKQIIQGEGMPKKWKEDKLVKEAREFYSSFKSDSTLLLEDMRVMVNKLRTQLKNMDLAELDEKGKPIYDIDKYTKVVTDLGKLIRCIDDTEKAIAKEMVQSDKVRGQAQKAMLEDA